MARTATIERNTAETRITGTVDVDGTGVYDVKTGIGFLDHMLEQLSRHSLIDLNLRAEGDVHIDAHPTTEDCGYVAGAAAAQALGERTRITRFRAMIGRGACGAMRFTDGMIPVV